MAPSPAAKLGKKAGPLPIWAWALVGGGALLAVFLLLRRNTEQGGSGIQIVTGNAQRPENTVSGGYPRGVTPAAEMLNDEVLWTIAGSLASLSESQGVLAAGGSDRRDEHKGLDEALADVKNHVSQTVAGATFQQPAVTTPTNAAAGSPAPIKANQIKPSRYYTFQPGKAPKGRKADEAPKGARLGFVQGKGYYVVG